MSMRREWPAIISIVILILPSIWFFVGLQIYAQVAHALPLCQEDKESEHYGNAPNSYDITLYNNEMDWFDTTNYTIDAWENVTIPSIDEGIELSGWWAESEEGAATVILVHGVRSCKENHAIILPGAILYNAGFNVLAIDLRDHGNSTIEDMRVSAGQKEWRDVVGAWHWLQDEKGVSAESIGVFGNSMGAATAALTFALEPEIQAVWLDASFHDMDRIIKSELERLNLPTMFAGAGIYAGIISSGEDITAHAPNEAARDVGNRSMFILHNEADERIPFVHGEDMCADAQASVTAGGHVECWFVNTSLQTDGYDGPVGHIVTMLTMTDEYEQRLVSFFTLRLGHDLAEDYLPIQSGPTPP